MTKLLRCAVVAAAIVGSQIATAETMISTLLQTAPFDYPYSGGTIGYIFRTPQAPVRLTHLGFWDYLEDGFAREVQVGIWNEDATLIASIALNADAQPLVNGFRYGALSESATLQAGMLYILGGFRLPGDAYSPNLRGGVDFTPREDLKLLGSDITIRAPSSTQ